MSSIAVSEFKIYCLTENTYISGWSIHSPMVCYNNNTHVVNLNSVQLLSTLDSNIVTIKEDKIPISRNTRIVQIALENIYPGESLSVEYIFPINMSMYLFDYSTGLNNISDNLSIHANPDTVLGLIGSDIESGDITFIGPPALIAYASIGFHLIFSDGINTDNVGMITDIDLNTSTVTIENPTNYAFSASNTLVSMTIKVFDKLILGPVEGVHTYGEKIIGGAAIPKGTVTRYIYKNNSISGDPVSLFIHLTCLY